MKETPYTFEDFLAIVRRLVSPDGCPWDREQTHHSLRKFAIEEAYELADAMDSGNPKKIADESGDLLLQVVLNACLGEKNGTYGIDDVTDAISRKMIRRHPSVFGLPGSDDWDAIKREERNMHSLAEELADIPVSLPALLRAEKVQKKLTKAGQTAPVPPEDDAELCLGKQLFDWVKDGAADGICPELALHRYLTYCMRKEMFLWL